MNLLRKEPVAEAERTLRRGGWFGATAILVYLASLKLLVHLLTNGNYGYFRDELYYMAAAEHLALGYVDFPPFVALVTALTRLLLGDSTVALRFLPALAGALVVVLAGLMARELGGGRFAQGLAALATLVAPSFLVMGTFISMDAFDQLFWVSAAYVLILILKQDRLRLWLLFGLIAGLGVLTKITVLYFGFAVFAALLLTSSRRHLLAPWPWLGGAIAVLFLLPYIFWQITHGWPTLEFWTDYGAKVDPASPIETAPARSSSPSAFPAGISRRSSVKSRRRPRSGASTAYRTRMICRCTSAVIPGRHSRTCGRRSSTTTRTRYDC